MKVQKGVNASDFLLTGSQETGKIIKSGENAGMLDFSSFLAGAQNDSAKTVLQNTKQNQVNTQIRENQVDTLTRERINQVSVEKENVSAKKTKADTADLTEAEAEGSGLAQVGTDVSGSAETKIPDVVEVDISDEMPDQSELIEISDTAEIPDVSQVPEAVIVSDTEVPEVLEVPDTEVPEVSEALGVPEVSEVPDSVKVSDILEIPVTSKVSDTVNIPTEVEIPDGEKVTGIIKGFEEDVVPAVPLEDKKMATAEDLAAFELVSNILQMVMEQFQLTEGGLTKKLEEFGMEMTDLLSTDGIKDFFLSMKSADISDLIVNEDLNRELQMCFEQFDHLLEESDLTQTDLAAFAVKDETVQTVTEFLKLQEVVIEDSPKKPADLPKEEPKIVSEEPEVIVTRQPERKQSNPDDFSKEEDKDSSKEKPEQGLETVKDVVVNKHKGFENPILHAIQEAVDQVEEIAVSEQPVNGQEVINQIVEQVRVNMNQEHTSLELQLYPEHLGRIQINVVSKDGVMTAKIVAETETAKQAIEGGLANLKEAMQQQDLKVDAIEVMVSTTGFEKGNEEQSSFGKENSASKSRRKIDLSELEEDVSESEDAELEKMKQIGSSVSYTA